MKPSLSLVGVFALFEAAAFASSSSCAPRPGPVTPPPLEVGDGGTEDPTVLGTPCGKACSRLRDLGCPEGFPTPEGGTCYEVCRSAGAHVNAACVADAKSIPEVNRCNLRCVR